jgi:hypothetical protein
MALLAAAPATAAVLMPKTYDGQTRLGSATSSRTVKGQCSISQGLTSLVLRCDGKGTAQARYLFTLSRSTGSVTAQVNFDGGRGTAKVATKRVSDTQFRVDVTQASRGRAEIESVMIEYYCH